MPIEKVWLPPEKRTVKNPDGTETTKTVNPWEIRASGKEVNELSDAFKDSGPEMMHEGWKEWNSIGETTITKPDGSTDVVRADKEHLYQAMPGFCKSATRPTFTVNVPWTGSMKKEGITRARYRYENGERVTVEEKRIGYHSQ